MANLQHIRIATGLNDLLAEAPPLWVVDAVNPVLHLEHDTAILGHGPGKCAVVLQALRRLDRERAVLAVARVHLEGLLFRVDVEPDAGPVRREAGDVAAVGAPVVRGGAADQPAVVWSFELAGMGMGSGVGLCTYRSRYN